MNLMKKTWVVLLSILAIAPVWAQDEIWPKSPQLEALIVELKQLYASDDLMPVDKRNMTEVDNLSFFILYIDKPEAPEHKLLKAYLWGMQEAHIRSVNEQIRTNIMPWFCPKGMLRNYSHLAPNPTQFVEQLIWRGIDYNLKYAPNRFRRPDMFAAFGTSSGFITDGLQDKYPCYQLQQSARVL